jgi:hypothetical protein
MILLRELYTFPEVIKDRENMVNISIAIYIPLGITYYTVIKVD